MSRRVRLMVWAGVVAGALAGMGVRLLDDGVAVGVLAAALGAGAAALMLRLLETTPPDAIRLPRWLSEAIIAFVCALGALSAGAAWGMAVAAGAAALALCMAMRLPVDRGRAGSAWWAAVWTWHPALGQLAALAGSGVRGPGGGPAWLVPAIGVALLVGLAHPGSPGRARWMALGVATLGAIGVAILLGA